MKNLSENNHKKIRVQKKDKLKLLFFLCFLLILYFVSIGFAVFSNEEKIYSSAQVRVYKSIRVSGVSVYDVSNNGLSNYEDYNVNNIHMGVNLPDEDSTITYEVEIANLGNVEMAISSITGLPDNLDYEIEDYDLRDKICDSEGICKNGAIRTIKIKVKYKDDEGSGVNSNYDSTNTEYSLHLNFDFKAYYTVSYTNFDEIDTTSYPKFVLEDETLEVSFPSSVESILIYSGTKLLFTDKYTFTNNGSTSNLSVTDIEANINIKLNNLLINSGDIAVNEFTVEALGNSTYRVNGSSYPNSYIRLSDVLIGGNHPQELINSGNLFSPIYLAGTTLKYSVEVLSGTTSASNSNDFRIVFRNQNNVGEYYYDFVDHMTNKIYTTVLSTDIYMVSLFSMSAVQYDNFVFKINIDGEKGEYSGSGDVASFLEDKTVIASASYTESSNDFTLTKYEDNYYLLNGLLKGGMYYISIEDDNFKIASSGSQLYNPSLAGNPRYKSGETYRFTYVPLYVRTIPELEQLAFLFRDTSTNVSAIPYAGKMSTFVGDIAQATTTFTVNEITESVGTLEQDASMVAMYIRLTGDYNFDNWLFKLEIEKDES